MDTPSERIKKRELPLNAAGIPCHSCEHKRYIPTGGWTCIAVGVDRFCEGPYFPLFKLRDGPVETLPPVEEKKLEQENTDVSDTVLEHKEESPATPVEIQDPERVAMEKEEAQNKFAYIVKRSKKLDKQGKPKQCGTYPLVLDIDGKDIPVTAIMAIRKEHGKIVAAEPLAIIVNQVLKMKLRPHHVSREEYAENLEKQLKAVLHKDPGPLREDEGEPAVAGEVVKTDE